MKKVIDMSKVIPTREMVGDEQEDTILLQDMLKKAEQYISKHNWCKRILEKYFGIGVGGIVAVFLFRILPNKEGVDEYIWVIVGDIPPLYITTENSPNPACALDCYIGAMEEWVKAVTNGNSVDDVAPVNVEPSLANALKLKSRLEFIDNKILSNYKDDLLCDEVF